MAVIFDLDGVLVDSEPLWQEAEAAAFAELGLHLEPRLLVEARGLRIDQSVALLLARARQNTGSGDPSGSRSSPPGVGLDAVDEATLPDRIVDRMIQLIGARGRALPGVLEALDLLAGLGVRLAVASSSPLRLIQAVVERLGLGGRFDALCSAENEPLGKPHPAVYLSCAAALGVDAAECLAVEDSLPGVIAAKAARMRCLAVPWAEQVDDPRFAIADHRAASLVEVDAARWRSLLSL